ncbi:uncharacterized protein B0J16DRAFT_383938 [Fusarium flagelliforme]|uniref:uncharacterized protein n=1 Tax=Fusarium flagelliforme TaxID=2675880 RepID=UPI001E8E3241|nr:uncharacterized protein B0J16DRAFT_383938 [Fusarium flagelliforme]KAH7184881.1 hypothetical protein B0J16DRAFT_383938 [Fusarium flagelliforme]
MKLAILVAVVALSSEALCACANTWDKCKPGDPNKCECNGKHIMKCLPSFPHGGGHKLVFAYRKLYVCPKNWHRECVDGQCVRIRKPMPTPI